MPFLKRGILRHVQRAASSHPLQHPGRSTVTVLVVPNRTTSSFLGPCPLRISSGAIPVRSFTTSGSDHHAFFQQQLEELERERTSILGPDLPSNPHSIDNNDLIATGNSLQVDAKKTADDADASTTTDEYEYEIDLEELHAERDALFQFSVEEKQAWGNFAQQQQSHQAKKSNSFAARLSPELLQEIAEARAAAAAAASASATEMKSPYPPQQSSSNTIPPQSQDQQLQHHESFSHLSPDGTSIHMVNVGHKEVTTRTAKAQSIVLLPPEVLEAFDFQQQASSSVELVGPKGPIFATAKLAGILAAKKTSDLIPLCHPLPLDQVQIEISMPTPHEILIDCTCRVTHKTGVEMEALTGASVAALTIYDMVKAVSHRVEITGTKLISKTGGKRTIQ